MIISRSTATTNLCQRAKKSRWNFVNKRNLAATTITRRPLQPFLLERFDGWNDSTMSLSSSECEALSLKELMTYADDKGLERWDSLSLGYVEPSNGSDYLREEIIKSQFNNQLTQLDPSYSVNVCAPQEGIFLAIQALCQPGDHIVAVAPAYQSLHEVAASIGCEVSLWWPEEREIEVEDRQQTKTTTTCMHFDPSTLEQLIQPNKTKLVIANFPHNPTGALPSLEEFRAMADLVGGMGNAWFLLDEMYRGLEHAGADHRLPPIATVMPRGISLGGVSKSFGLPGLRIGWLVNQDRDFHKRVSELKDYTTICPPAPSEALAYIALRAQEQLWQRSHSILQEGLPRLREFVQATTATAQDRYSFEWCEPMGGTFAWVKFSDRHGTTTASEYSEAVRQRTGLMMVPSGLFPECLPENDRLRMTYGKKGVPELLQVLERDLALSREEDL
ncbi:Kynurenine--oxoglutarate transaminase 3 [Seminavis robusta]|uniref:Kynurenine--oxoglutarate transaminase 3 n=1 Tax=Seminavis robusta TaxID=568900 RepID=A0A9N8D8K7_9STRA|nr:Kynurenine--oxoglutarate transaminase 3 [Seminavis robusta]|eukprot:Sro16_g011490.1 Kynurenine--oxoglutarate transaminase 3 (446) ;mRNA; r:10002-11339